MNNFVPEGKRVYIGSRKFLSGQPLPPHVRLNDPDDIPEVEPIKEIEKPKSRTKRKYTRKIL